MSTKDEDARPTGGEISPEDRAEIKRRASDLDQRLKKARGPGLTARRSEARGVDGAAMGRALRLSTELVGGLVVGTVIGLVLDRVLGTWPWLFIVFFMLGAAAGILNVMRAAMAIRTGPSDPSKGPSVPDDDETG